MGSKVEHSAPVPSNAAQIINLKSSRSRALTFDVIRLLAPGPNQSHALGAKFLGQDCKDIPSRDITNVKRNPRSGGYVLTSVSAPAQGPRGLRPTMENALVRKLEGYIPLAPEDKRLLNSFVRNIRQVPAHTDLATEDERPTSVHLVLEGFACRYKCTAEGNRQIMAYLVPGDFCDMHVMVLKQMDHSIATISPCAVVDIPRDSILKLLESPTLSLALWCAALVDAAVLREWLVNVGQRRAGQRLAHVLCELLLRLRIVGLAENSYDLPLSQRDLADTIGVSNVHLNRVLQELRREDLISWKDEVLVVKDIDRLMTFSGFNPNYLHIGRQGANQATKSS